MIDIDLYHQFLLSPDGPVSRAGWHGHSCGGYHLLAHPSLPVNRVSDSEGRDVGYILGWPIDPSGKLVRTPLRLPLPVDTLAAEDLERTVYGLGGRFAFVILTGALQRLYLDPGGTLGVVFLEKRRMAGSTVAALVLEEPEHALWSMSPGEFPDNRPNQFWPAGTTLDPHIRRLLPNHYLDLVTWRAIRHYPKFPLEALPDGDVPACIEKVVRVLRRMISAVLESTPRLYLPLTAGRDSRMLLACARAWCDRVEFVTFDYSLWRKSRSEELDLDVARRLAKRFGLRHRVVPVSPRMPEGAELQYLRRIGFAGGAGKSRDFDWACRQHLDLAAGWLTGFAGTVGRAAFTRAGDDDTQKMSVAQLQERLRVRLPPSDRLQAALREWSDGLPPLPLSLMIEFAYLENRVAGWAAPHLYGAAPFSINLIPFSHREIFDSLLRLPSAYRRSKAVASDIVAAEWPELLALPFNEPPTWIGRSIWNGRSALKRRLGRP